MARIDLPESRLRLRKRRRRLRLAVFFVVLFVLLLSGLVGLTYWPALQIDSVAVSGAQTLPPRTVEAFVRARLAGSYWYVLPKSNIFLYPKSRIRADLLAAYPVLASADVYAANFHTVAVGVAERQPRALWCPSNVSGPSAQCYFMDENGAVYGEAPTFSEPVYTAYRGAVAGESLPKQFLSPEEFRALSALVDAIVLKLPDEKLVAVGVTADNDIYMSFADGFVLRFALNEQGGDVFERLGLALTAEPFVSRKLAEFEYLDLRFGDKLYYKLK